MIDYDDARQRPFYTIAEVARWSKTTAQSARRWISGYTFPSATGERWSRPVTGRRDEAPLLTFEDLIEVAAVSALRGNEISLQKIRAAVQFMQGELGIDRPLLSERLHTDGRELFMRDTATEPHYTNVSRLGQLAWSRLEDMLREIDYEDRIAARWWPSGRSDDVLVDPRVNFGRPIIATIGVRTETLVDRFAAGSSIEDVADEYGTIPSLVQAALRFENRAGAIAA